VTQEELDRPPLGEEYARRLVEYYREGFRADLDAVMALGRWGRGELSVVHLVPARAFDERFRNQEYLLADVSDERSFLLCVFLEVLIDQALYTVTGRDLASTTGRTWWGVKLTGFLGSGSHYMHPAFALLALSLRLPRSVERRNEVVSRITVALRALTAEALWQLGEQVPSKARLVHRCMSEGLAPTELPQSLRAFVPWGDSYPIKPDLAAVAEWAEATRGAIVDLEGD
jgi:hypothetical protein